MHRGERKREQGLGLWSVLVIISVAIFIGLFALRVVPHYMENWTVKKIASDLVENHEVLKQPRTKVYQHLKQAYRNNNLWDLNPEDTIQLTKHAQKGYLVNVQYEKRANLFHNIDLVTRFDQSGNAL